MSFSCSAFILTVDITGQENTKGSIAFAIHKNQDGFPEKNSTAVYRNFISFNQIPHKVELPKGEYAISIYHDENNNKELDTNFVGIPKESFGFSNNAIGLMGPPSFEKAKIILNADKKIQIKFKSI